MENQQKKIVFIVNPISGTTSKKHVLELLEQQIDREKYQYEVVYTEYAGHAEKIAAEKAQEGVFAVVAIGGDGTINEVGRSLRHTDTAMAIIPCGSGNGLARHLKIPMDVKKALDIINRGYVEEIDYGLINERPFFCTCGVGFDAFVSLKFAEAGKRGPITYVQETLKVSLSYKPETYEIEVDGKESQRYRAFLVACANASQYGNNAYIAPQATLKDGFLDITILEPFNILDVPSLSFQLFNKTIDQNSRIKTLKGKTVRIIREKEGVAHFDGDPMIMEKDLLIKIVEQGLKVIVPEDPKIYHTGMIHKAKQYANAIVQLNEELFQDIKTVSKKIVNIGNGDNNKAKEE